MTMMSNDDDLSPLSPVHTGDYTLTEAIVAFAECSIVAASDDSPKSA